MLKVFILHCIEEKSVNMFLSCTYMWACKLDVCHMCTQTKLMKDSINYLKTLNKYVNMILEQGR